MTSTLVVNACDAGREGELIFAYLYEKSGSHKPVQRLWLNSMTKAGDPGRVRRAATRRRAGARSRTAARSRSEADWIVGMNATRAATIRLRSSFDGAVSLGRVQTPTLAILARREEEIRAFKPEPYWLVDASFDAVAEPAGAGLRGPLPRRGQPAPEDRRGSRRRSSPPAQRPDRRDHQAREDRAQGTRAAALRPHLAAARRQQPLRLLRPAHPGRRPAAVRGAQGADLSADQLALPHRRHGRRDQADRRAGRRAQAEYAAAAEYVLGLDVLPLGRVVNDAKVTDHHAIIPTRAEQPSRWTR